MDFQEYFVHRRQGPEVREVRFSGDNQPTEAVVEAIAAAEVIVIGPSNPIVSPARPGRFDLGSRYGTGACRVPVVAISPIVGGVALKGPADRMLVARPRIESPGEWPGGPWCRHGLRARHARCRARTRDRGSWLPDTRRRHGHGRPPRPCPTRATSSNSRGRGRCPRHAPVKSAAIIPVGTLEGAKTRLGGTLDAEERHDLVEGLLARTVAAALAVDRLDDVLVISPDPEVLTRAAETGARTLRQRTSGLNAGLAEARAGVCWRRGGGPGPADRPAVRHSRGRERVPRGIYRSARGRARRARHRPPRHGHQRTRPSTARVHRFCVRTGEQTRPPSRRRGRGRRLFRSRWRTDRRPRSARGLRLRRGGGSSGAAEAERLVLADASIRVLALDGIPRSARATTSATSSATRSSGLPARSR